MKAGIFLVIVGGIIGVWFFALPLWLGVFGWIDTGSFSVNWFLGDWGWIVGVICGGFPFTIGQEKIMKARAKCKSI